MNDKNFNIKIATKKEFEVVIHIKKEYGVPEEMREAPLKH